MESHPQNPEFRNNPVNFYPCNCNEVYTMIRSACNSEFNMRDNDISLKELFRNSLNPYIYIF